MTEAPRNTREHALHLIREERARQVQMYGDNADLRLGFGSRVTAYPWLTPYSDVSGRDIEAAFRRDYEQYEQDHGEPTWMHLIREEVSELFAARNPGHQMEEALQLAALCVSLAERLMEGPVEP